MNDPNKVDFECSAYKEMKQHWPLIHALLAGTQAMRDAGEEFLPKETKETPKQYKDRLARSILYGAYADTITKLASKPFAEAVVIEEMIPELEGIEENTDGQGRNITQFAWECFKAGATYGLIYILVEYPKKVDKNGQVIKRSKAQERALNEKPYFVHITPPNMIAWKTRRDANGLPVLTEIRFKEKVMVEDGKFGEKVEERIRVYTEKDVTVWIKGKDDQYHPEATIPHTFKNGIPLVPVYFNRDGYMTAQIPLDRLAWMNLAHWQSLSDQRNILRFSRFALLMASGFTPNEVKAGFIVGSNRMIHSTNPEAKIAYVEHTGKAIATGEADLQSLEARMEVLGLQPLMSNLGNVLATGQAINEAKQQSSMESWVRSLEGALLDAYGMAGIWIGRELKENAKVEIFSDFSLGLKASEDINALIAMRKTVPPCISHETFLKEVKRRGILADTVDPMKEISAIGEEAPAMGTPITDEDAGLTGNEGEEGDEEE